MNVLFRLDCTPFIGMGHLMRCIALSTILLEKGARVIFIIENLNDDTFKYLKAQGFEAFSIHFDYAENLRKKNDADATIQIIKKLGVKITWIIIDHYGLDKEWEIYLRPYTKNIMVIDDLADRAHECDILIDQNIHDNPHLRYRHLVPRHTALLLGPNYALLRKDFRNCKEFIKPRNGRIEKILIFFGGGDYTAEIMKAFNACFKLNRTEISIDVVTGSACSHRDKIKERVSRRPNVHYFCYVEKIAALMSTADLAIGAGGSAHWERCCLGLPSIVISIAQNQVAITQNLASLGVLRYLGAAKEVSEEEISEAILQYLNDGNVLKEMSIKAYNLVDGRGSEKVAERLYGV